MLLNSPLAVVVSSVLFSLVISYLVYLFIPISVGLLEGADIKTNSIHMSYQR